MYGQIIINDNERFQVDTRELTSGDVLQVLVLDAANRPTWVETSVEHNGNEYYLTGLLGFSVAGLFAHI